FDEETKKDLSSTDTTTKPEPDEKNSFDKRLQDIQASAAMPEDMRDTLPDQPKVEQPDVNSVLTEIERTTAQTPSNSQRTPTASNSLPVITIVKPIVVKMIHGSATLSPGMKLPMISRGKTTVQVRYLDSAPIIPISATDAQ